MLRNIEEDKTAQTAIGSHSLSCRRFAISRRRLSLSFRLLYNSLLKTLNNSRFFGKTLDLWAFFAKIPLNQRVN